MRVKDGFLLKEEADRIIRGEHGKDSKKYRVCFKIYK